MIQHFRPAFVMLVLFTVLTGLAYPFAITGVAQLALPAAANGSLVKVKGKFVGSALIGQSFAAGKYFQSRPSATSAPDPADATKTVDAPYNASNSSGSNLGPISQKLIDRLKADGETLKATGYQGAIPADALTTSASGLDPHISPAFAALQAAAIAKARNLPEAKVKALVEANTERPLIGLFGEPRVNVLLLNIALDGLSAS